MILTINLHLASVPVMILKEDKNCVTISSFFEIYCIVSTVSFSSNLMIHHLFLFLNKVDSFHGNFFTEYDDKNSINNEIKIINYIPPQQNSCFMMFSKITNYYKSTLCIKGIHFNCCNYKISLFWTTKNTLKIKERLRIKQVINENIQFSH